MTAGPVRPALDVLVIGGGQAGLAMGYHLAQRGLRFQIVESGPELGSAWRSRWDSLRLFTPGRYDNLPGLPFPADADSYPGKEDVADYLAAYAAEFDLPVRLDTSVTSLARAADGSYLVKAGPDALEAGQVVVATGAFQQPFTPPVAADLAPDVHQLHSADYRRPAQLPPGRVLVVGAANSGCQMALELSATRTVDLAVGTRIPAVPQRPLGRDVWWWGTRLRLDRVTADSRLGRGSPAATRSSAPAPGSSPAGTASRSGRGSRPWPDAASPSPMAPTSNTTPWCGRPDSAPTTRGSTSRTSPTNGAGCGRPAGSPHRRGSTRWAGSGSTPAARR